MSASCAPRSVSALVAVDARAPPACLFFLLKPCHDHARRIRLRFAGGTTTAGWSGETSPPSARSASGLSGARSPLPSSWGFAPHPPWSGTSAPPSRTPGSGSACAVRAEVATTELACSHAPRPLWFVGLGCAADPGGNAALLRILCSRGAHGGGAPSGCLGGQGQGRHERLHQAGGEGGQ